MAIVLADSVSRLRTVGPYHDLDLKDQQQEFSASFEPLPPIEPMNHTPLEVKEVFITLHIEYLRQNYEALHNLYSTWTDKAKLPLENASPADIPNLELNLMSVSELTRNKLIKLQKSNTFCKNILQYIHFSKNNNYIIDAIGILHKKVINFNSPFSAMAVPQISIKYLLHASHDT